MKIENYDSYLEMLYYAFCADDPDTEESLFFYNRIFEDIKLFAKPELVDRVDNHFYGLVCGLSRADSVPDFKSGFRLAMLLMSECNAEDTQTRNVAEKNYKRLYADEAAEHDRLKALYTTKEGAL